MSETNLPTFHQAATGIDGLDQVLNGGFPRHRSYLVQGGPGTGKTTLGLQFLLAGARAGERVLYLTLSQTDEDLRNMAQSHGWSLEGVDVHELIPTGTEAGQAREQTFFHPSEVELPERIDALQQAVKSTRPARVVFDSINEIRLLAGSPLRYRQEILALRRFFNNQGCTALFLDGERAESGDEQLQLLMDGTIRLERTVPDYGDDRRRLHVVKMRNLAHRTGFHDFQIRHGGLEVYPRLEVSGTGGRSEHRVISSGLDELDALLGGGLEAGTACLLMGSVGTGKTTLATLYAHSAAQRGERAALFIFDERPETFYERSAALNMDLRPFVAERLITVREIGTGEISPGEFAHLVQRTVDEGASLVIIDSLTGYLNAMPQEHLLLIHMQELLSYLNRRGVLSLLVTAQHGIIGADLYGSVDVGFMADSVLLLRHFEAAGVIRQAISAVKKRNGRHERTIRELKISSAGVAVGEPLTQFNGVLTGTPSFEGEDRDLMRRNGG